MDDFLDHDSWLNYLVRSDEAASTQEDARARIEQLKQEREKLAMKDLQAITQGDLVRLDARRKELDKKIQEYKTSAAAAKSAQDSLESVEIDAEMQANVPIFAKMEGVAILSLMKGWENPRIVRYLRALKASKAAEVLEAMRMDPLFERNFRQPPPGADPESPTRFDLVMEEFKKVPKTGPAE